MRPRLAQLPLLQRLFNEYFRETCHHFLRRILSISVVITRRDSILYKLFANLQQLRFAFIQKGFPGEGNRLVRGNIFGDHRYVAHRCLGDGNAEHLSSPTSMVHHVAGTEVCFLFEHRVRCMDEMHLRVISRRTSTPAFRSKEDKVYSTGVVSLHQLAHCIPGVRNIESRISSLSSLPHANLSPLTSHYTYYWLTLHWLSRHIVTASTQRASA